MVQDYMIHRFISRRGKATKQEIYKALGSDEESNRIIEEKLRMMERFGIVAIQKDVVTMRKKETA